MVKKKEKKREVPPLTKQRRGIPWEYLSRMRSAVGTTGSCTENHTGSRFHQDLKARTEISVIQEEKDERMKEGRGHG